MHSNCIANLQFASCIYVLDHITAHYLDIPTNQLFYSPEECYYGFCIESYEAHMHKVDNEGRRYLTTCRWFTHVD